MEEVVTIGVDDIPLNELLNKNPSACKTFCADLQLYGFAVLDISNSKDFVNLRDTLRKEVHHFFQQPPDIKNCSLCENEYDIGYIDIPEVKEIFQIRLSNENWVPFPSEPFKNACIQYYQYMYNLSKHCLQVIASQSNIPEELFLNILDPPFKVQSELNETSPSSHMMTSLLRIIRYHTSWETNKHVHMYHHSDIGLLTLVPISSIQGLEVLRQTDMQWIEIERYTDPEKHILVIPAELLQAITRKKYRALMHRVICKGLNRISMPFFTIPRPDVPIKLMNEEDE